MKFFQYESEYSIIKKFLPRKTTWQDFYSQAERIFYDTRSIDPFAPVKIRGEKAWIAERRPYYKIYPSIIPCLTKISLDSLKVDHVNFPLKSLVLNFPDSPEKHSLKFTFEKKEYLLRNIMVLDNFKFDNKEEEFLIFWLNAGEFHAGTEEPVYLFRYLSKKEGLTVTEGFNSLKEHPSSKIGVQYPDEFIEECAKLVCTLSLMNADPNIVQPEVLSDDENKYEKTKDPNLVKKAIRRGKHGWSVGRDIEISPHIRAACPSALYWTGKGKTIPKVRFRKGCIVHRKKIEDLPSGYMGEE